MSNKNRNRIPESAQGRQFVEAQAAPNETRPATPEEQDAFAARQAAEFPDGAKIREVDTGRAPDWQNDAYLLLNEFRAHGGIMQFLQEKSSGMVHPETGQTMLGNLRADDRAACVKLLLPFRADSRVARFCGVAEMTVKEAN